MSTRNFIFFTEIFINQLNFQLDGIFVYCLGLEKEIEMMVMRRQLINVYMRKINRIRLGLVRLLET